MESECILCVTRYEIEEWPLESGVSYCVVKLDDIGVEYESVILENGDDACFASEDAARLFIQQLENSLVCGD